MRSLSKPVALGGSEEVKKEYLGMLTEAPRAPSVRTRMNTRLLAMAPTSQPSCAAAAAA